MKRFVSTWIFFFCLASTEAQVKTNASINQASSIKKIKLHNKGYTMEKDTLISLTATASYAAKSTPSISVHENHLRIMDPVVVALSERAKGSEVFISSSGIIGMPRRAYGFANGKILFRSTVATSSGSTGGHTSVGTGGSVSGIGTGGSFIGLNGKSPDAGLGMWGSARGLNIAWQ